MPRAGQRECDRVVLKALGRPTQGRECVHHVDGDPTNNKPGNLVICPNDKYHFMLHAHQRIVDLGGHWTTHAYCDYHKCLHPKKEFSTVPSHWNGLSNRCRAATNEYRKNKGLNRNKFDWRARLNQQYRRAFKTGRVLKCRSF